MTSTRPTKPVVAVWNCCPAELVLAAAVPATALVVGSAFCCVVAGDAVVCVAVGAVTAMFSAVAAVAMLVAMVVASTAVDRVETVPAWV